MKSFSLFWRAVKSTRHEMWVSLQVLVAATLVLSLLLFLVVWVLRRLGVSFETEALASAHILQIFTSNTPLSVLTFLR